MDTGVVLQLRRALEVMDQDLTGLTTTLASLAGKYRGAPIAARTWMQQALPTTFGFIVAGWLDAILRHRARLAELRSRNLALQFGGAVGTLCALSGRGPEVAKALAEELRLPLPPIPWHSPRDRIGEIAAALGLCTGTLGKIARDISLHAQTEISRAILPSVPVQSPSAAAISPMRSRGECQGIGGRGKRSSSASALATSGPRPESAHKVPTAPPNCSAKLRDRNSARRARWRRIASNHPATIKPKVVGSACCIQVRAAIGAPRYLPARLASVVVKPVRS